ncbi:MAG: LysR family transcriptional regulator [Betaproteobacteria bacterium]|nr:LysR family transcriptional regulator [Betaproteobacteria bacterium]
MKSLLDIQTLRVFVAVAKEGNVSRAAQRVHLSQPAASLQLKSLSEHIGQKLFVRTPQGMALTRAGALLLPKAEKALSAMFEINELAQTLNDTVHGTLSVGTILEPEFIRLGLFLKTLAETLPQVTTELRQGMTGSVLAQVARRELDTCFYLAVPSKTGEEKILAPSELPQFANDFEVLLLTPFTYNVIAPAGWGPQVLGRDWAALATLPWVATPTASIHHRLLSSVFGPGSLTGVDPRRVALVDQEASMIDLVKSGVGLSLARDFSAIRQRQAHGLVIADSVSFDCVLCFVCLKTRRDEPIVARAWSALETAWKGATLA